MEILELKSELEKRERQLKNADPEQIGFLKKKIEIILGGKIVFINYLVVNNPYIYKRIFICFFYENSKRILNLDGYNTS